MSKILDAVNGFRFHRFFGLLALFSTQTARSISKAAAHASLTTATMATTAGFLVTIPARSIYNWTTGASTLSCDWAKLSCDNQALINTGMYRIRQWYPVDTSSSTYQWTYAIANTGFELGTLAIGGLGLAKTGYSVLSSLELYGHWTRSSQKAVLGADRLVAQTNRLAKSLGAGAENVNAGVYLNRKFSELEQAPKIASRIRTLPDGRSRFYKPERSAHTQGTIRGSSYVTEYNPETGKVRGWNECYEQSGQVGIVHPKNIDGQPLISPHYFTNID